MLLSLESSLPTHLQKCNLFLQHYLGVPKGAVVLTSGETSRNKVVQVEGISVEIAIAKLAALT